jgi:hypothetical protein
MEITASCLAEDELYASLVARVAAFYGASIEEVFHRRSKIFNNVAALRDYGALAGQFCEIMEGQCGSASELINHGTLIAYYCGRKHWSQESRGQPWRHQLRMGEVLRLCSSCFAHDVNYYGVALWHKCHQLPLTHVCLRHTQALYEIPLIDGLRTPKPSDLILHDYICGPEHLETLAVLARCEKRIFISLCETGLIDRQDIPLRKQLAQHHQDARHIDRLCIDIRARLCAVATKGILENAIGWPRLEKGLVSFLGNERGRQDPISMSLLSFLLTDSVNDVVLH